MSFADALNESMSSSPNRWDNNIDPALQNTPRLRPLTLSAMLHSAPTHTISTLPAGVQDPNEACASTPQTGPNNAPQACEQSVAPGSADSGSSSDDDPDDDAQPEMTQTQTIVHQLARQNQLSQGNIQELMNFATLYTQKARDLHLYGKILALEQITGGGTAWTPSSDAMRNIQQYCNSVLMSPELPSYRSTMTSRIVMDVLKSSPSQLPSGWEADPHKTALVMKCVTECLTQGRSNIKKKLVVSTAPVEGSDSKVDIAELATGIASNSIIVTAALWARLAFLQGVLGTDSGNTFWKSVDVELKKLRDKAMEKAQNNEEKAKKKLHRLFKNILELDFQVYGNPANRRMTPSQGPLKEWQRAADTAASNALTIPILHKRKAHS